MSRFAIVVALFGVLAGPAFGQVGERTIRVIVPQPPGGSMDTNARALAEPLQQTLGQTIVVDNRSGANGIIAGDVVAKAAADGTTYLYTSNSFANNEVLHKSLPFDVQRDFVPVTLVAKLPGYMVLVNPKVPAHSVAELVALSKKSSSPLHFGSGGIGNSQHLLGELLNERTGAKLAHVPYKGLAPVIAALLGGEIDVAFAPPTTVVQHVKAGRLRAIAYTGVARWPDMPDVPTVAESGVPGFVFDDAWHGLFAPAATPLAVVARMRDAVTAALAQPKIRAFLAQGGYVPVGDTPAEFRTFLDGYLTETRKLAAIAHIEPE